jgi:hypothetical protein
MTFWLGVAVAYICIMIVGVSLGLTLAHKFPGQGREQWDIPPEWNPSPGGLSVDEELRQLIESER